MNHNWYFSNLQFDSATKGNFAKAVTISSYLDASLYAARSTSSAILALYNYYHPIHLNLLEAYDIWKAKGGRQKGDTAALTQIFRQMTSNVNKWDAAIQAVYEKGSPQYIALLPLGHGPFTQGKQTDRISAIKSLSTNLETEPDLAALKILVDDCYTLIMSINVTQKGDKSYVNIDSDALEGARVEMCFAQYYVVGGLIQEFTHTPNKVAEFFDLPNIRSIKQKIYSGTLHTVAPHHILKHTFKAGHKINVINDGDTELKIYLSHLKEGAIGTTFITVPAGTDAEYPVSDLGDIANTFLTVQCDAGSGHYEVELL